MNTFVRVTALAATAAAALFFAQPSQAITPAMQPHSIIGDFANADSLVTTVARRGGYGGGTVYRGRGVHRGGVYRGRGVYRGGVYRGGVYRGGVYRRAGIGYGAMCGYAPYPPCAGGYYGGVYRGGVYRGGVYRGGVAYRRGGVYRGGVHRGGAHRVYRGGRRR